MAVRFDASGDYLLRTANLPTLSAFTICGWAQMATDTNTYSTLCSLEQGTSSAANYILLSTDTDGVSLKVWTAGGTGTTIATITVGTPFFFALTNTGTTSGTITGYFRAAGTNALSSQTGTGSFITFTPGAAFIGNDSYTEPFDGRVWNVKVWDRALTASELLVESFYERPHYPSSLNLWWPAPNSGDTADRSGNGRNATVGGTLTTEDSTVNLWRPSRRILIPAGSASASSGALSVTLGDVTSSATGTVAIAGTALPTLANATLSATGKLALAGVLSSTLADTTLSASGTLASSISGTLSVTLGNATLSSNTSPLPPTGWSFVNVTTPNTTAAYRITASPDIASGDQIAWDSNGGLVTVYDDGTFSVDPSITDFGVMVWSTGEGWGAQATQDVPQIGELAVTLANVTLSAAGAVRISGAASPTLAAVTLSAAGAVSIAGAALPTLGNVTLSAAGALSLNGAADITLGDVTLAAAGVLSAPGTGTADITLADVTVSAAATLALAGSASITLSAVTTSAAGALPISGAASLTLDAVTLSAAGQAAGPVSGEAAITLDDVTVQAEGGTKRGGRRKRVRDGLGEARLMSTKGQASITLDAVSVVATGEIVVPQAPEVVLPPIAASVSVILEDISCKARGEGAAMVDGLKRSTVPNGLLLKRLANIEQMLAHMKATQ